MGACLVEVQRTLCFPLEQEHPAELMCRLCRCAHSISGTAVCGNCRIPLPAVSIATKTFFSNHVNTEFWGWYASLRGMPLWITSRLNCSQKRSLKAPKSFSARALPKPYWVAEDTATYPINVNINMWIPTYPMSTHQRFQSLILRLTTHNLLFWKFILAIPLELV